MVVMVPVASSGSPFLQCTSPSGYAPKGLVLPLPFTCTSVRALGLYLEWYAAVSLSFCFRLYASSLAVDVYFRYISCQTCVIALPGPSDPWAAIAKIGSSAWAEGRVLGSLQLVSEL